MSFTLDGFEIGNRIGAGGFGEVWEARQIGVDRPVAIKVGNTAIRDATDQLRFERECKALGRLSTHANIVTVYTSGQLPDGRPILVLEYVDGDTLQKWALNNASTEAQIMNIGSDLASALVEAHSHQILHRDLKPQNVLLRTNGEAILADFGIAQMQDGLRTVTGNVTASAAYAAPEVLDGNRATEQSDIYGIGICMLAAATQSTPFTDADDTTLYPVLTRVLTAEPPDTTAFGYSAQFNDLVQRLLQKDPAQRFNSATEVLTELRRLNIGPDSYQRVTPEPARPEGVGSDPVSGDAATEGPEITPNNSGKLVHHAPHQPVVQHPAPQPVAQHPAQQPAPQHVAQVPPEAPAPATVGMAAQPTAAPPAQGYPQTPNVAVGAETVGTAAAPTAVTTAGGMSPAKIGAIIGGVLLGALALFFAFGRGGGDDPVAAEVSTNSTQSTQSTESAQSTQSTESAESTESTQSTESAQSTQQNATEPAASEPDDTASDPEPASSAENSAAPAAPLPAGEAQEVSGSIDIALDFRDFPVELVAGQEVSVHLTSVNGSCDRDDNFDLRIRLLDPAGEQIGSDAGVQIWGCKGFGEDWMAEEDGIHTVRFVSAGQPPATGTFEATIATKRRAQEMLASGTSVAVAATIDRALDSIAYQVELQAGQSASVGLSSMNGSCDRADGFELKAGLFGPTGERIGDEVNASIWGCEASGRWTAEEDGLHSVVFFSADGPGAFEAVVGLPQETRESLDSGERVHQISGNITIPRDDVGYSIDLTAGQQLSVDLTAMNGSCDRGDGFGLRVALLGPDGERIGDAGNASIWGCKAFGPWAAEVDGTHTVLFFEDEGTTGSFEATIGRLGG